ncbi:MAG: adenylate/guanylate cyclase domain-containing protein [Nitratireductor sp.]
MKPHNIDKMRSTGKGPLIQRVRLWSGLILLFYVTLHYINHALGHISLEAMETFLHYNEDVWGTLPGQIVLYGALLTHSLLGLWKFAGLRTWRLPVWEWTQILLGLLIPWMLLSHIVYTRASSSILGIEVDYRNELLLLWPDVWLRQSFLLLVVWLHAAMGIHFWLRIRAWYPAWIPIIAGFAVLVPTLALTGWIVAARREFDAIAAAAAKAVPGTEASAAMAEQIAANRQILDALGTLEWFVQTIALASIALAAFVMALRWLAQRFSTRVRVTYGDGTTIMTAPGNSILEISRASGIPHMSVCGGRARCSTCRTLIVEGLENCTAPTDAEKLLLSRLNADPGVRLACQCRVRGDVDVRPLIQSRTRIAAPRNVDPLGWGVEREIAVLFLDIRGFSRISEKSLPYDVVFILNSLFGEVGAEIEAHNGYIDKFMGDGMMALFGLASTPQEASRDAIRAALAAQRATEHASNILTQHLSEPLRVGIGIHTGDAVIGRIGRTSDQTTPSRLTAIGDTVNVAARLEAATKELSARIVISAATMELAGVKLIPEIGEGSSIHVHNITAPIDVVAITDLEPVANALGGTAANTAPPLGRWQSGTGFGSRIASRFNKTPVSENKKAG